MLNLRASLHFGSLGQGLALEGAIQAIPVAMVLKVICRSAQFWSIAAYMDALNALNALLYFAIVSWIS